MINQLILGNQEFKNVKNIIFDLGGVIINIDYHATINAFKKIGFSNFDTIFSQMTQAHVFDNYDKGFVLPSEFRNKLRKTSGINFSDEDFDSAWNAMLLDLPIARVETLKKLREHFKIFLLSNTNEIHLDYFFKYFDTTLGSNVFESLFDKLYYSCRMGMRKPDLEIYQKVVDDSSLQASESLFIDDIDFNVCAAINAGLQSYHIKNGEDIVSLFAPYLT